MQGNIPTGYQLLIINYANQELKIASDSSFKSL